MLLGFPVSSGLHKILTILTIVISFMSLKNAQEIHGEEGKVTMIYVKIKKDAHVEQVTQSIEDKYGDDITTVASLEDL